jgi:hypothetical protein
MADNLSRGWPRNRFAIVGKMYHSLLRDTATATVALADAKETSKHLGITIKAQNNLVNIPISNVPGPRVRGRIGGATLSEIYSVGPLTFGVGLNINVWSYVDQLSISVLADDATSM